MPIYETFYNRYKGWGTGKKPEGIIEVIMRSSNHSLSPSTKLLNDWQNRKHSGMTWEDYEKRFFNEMTAPECKKELTNKGIVKK